MLIFLILMMCTRRQVKLEGAPLKKLIFTKLTALPLSDLLWMLEERRCMGFGYLLTWFLVLHFFSYCCPLNKQVPQLLFFFLLGFFLLRLQVMFSVLYFEWIQLARLLLRFQFNCMHLSRADSLVICYFVARFLLCNFLVSVSCSTTWFAQINPLLETKEFRICIVFFFVEYYNDIVCLGIAAVGLQFSFVICGVRITTFTQLIVF